MPNNDTTNTGERVYERVREGYGHIAANSASSVGVGGCCGPAAPGGESCGRGLAADQLAQQIGYTKEELDALPQGANLGLSCGNPAAIAAIKPGQVVLDLGSGAGFDVFLMGPKVGKTGRAIGVDMTSEMIAKARKNAMVYREQTGLDNIEFRLGEIEHLPVADNSIDVIISNCVINLSPDKPQVWREVARVLKPGGRVAVSDIALLKPLPEGVIGMVEALVGCVAGAVMIDEYREMVERAGLTNVRLDPKPGYVEALSQSRDPLYQKIVAELPQGASAADYLTSVNVTAEKRA